MLTFHKIRYKNFLMTGNSFTEIDLDRSSKTLIMGKNGYGKSTILDALTFCLFGKPFRNINKPQLVNSINNKDTRVEIEFSTMNNNYTVCRGIKPTVFEIWKNGKLLNQPGGQKGNKDYQKLLEDTILKLNFKSFTQIDILGSVDYTQFMKLDAASRRIFIESLLDIDVFTVMNMLLKDEVKHNKEEISKLNTNIQIAEEKIEILKSYLNKLKDGENNDVDSINRTIEKVDNKIRELDDKEREALINQEKKEDLLKLLSRNNLEEEFNDLNSTIAVLNNNNKNLIDELSFFKLHSNCPTCEQNIDDTLRNDKIRTISDLISSNNEQIKKNKDKLSKVEYSLKEIEDLKKEIGLLISTLSQLRHNKEKCKDHLRDLKKKLKHQVELVEEENKLTKFKSQLDKLHNKKNDLLKNADTYKVAENLLKDNGVKSKIVNQYIPVINQLINSNLSKLGLNINFTLDENFNETIKSRYRDNFSYGSFSNGQKLRIDIALLLTWREVAKLKNSVDTNLLIMDEIFDASLDNDGCEDFMNMIQSFPENVNLFIISHKGDLIIDSFDDVITFENNKGFSKMIRS